MKTSYRGFLLATTSGLVAAGSAQAADLPAKAPPVFTPAAPNWTGWYIGLHAGGAWHLSDVSTAVGYGNGSYSGSGFIGGGQIGYNWQRGNVVYGFEADGSGLSGHTSGFSQGNSAAGKTINNKIRWLSTVRGRLGLAVGDTMAYMTGGVAFGGVKNELLNSPSGVTKSVSKTRVGWTIGGGVEHMLTPNWIVGLEGLFVDLGHSEGLCSCGDTEKRTRFSNQAVIGRVKLNYKF